MRTLVLLFMVALLPLRMWAAEGMAVRMAQQEVAAAAHTEMSSMPEDCPMMAMAAVDHGSGHERDAPQSATHCVVCHLCAASACLPDVALGHGPKPAGPPEAGAIRYASAEVAPDLRPPIP